jgi:hypothetical protein
MKTATKIAAFLRLIFDDCRIDNENDPAIIEKWLMGIRTPSEAARSRIRVAYKVCKIIHDHYPNGNIVQSWLQAKNTHLNDAIPMLRIRRMSDNDPGFEVTLIEAAQRFLDE